MTGPIPPGTISRSGLRRHRQRPFSRAAIDRSISRYRSGPRLARGLVGKMRTVGITSKGRDAPYARSRRIRRLFRLGLEIIVTIAASKSALIIAKRGARNHLHH